MFRTRNVSLHRGEQSPGNSLVSEVVCPYQCRHLTPPPRKETFLPPILTPLLCVWLAAFLFHAGLPLPLSPCISLLYLLHIFICQMLALFCFDCPHLRSTFQTRFNSLFSCFDGLFSRPRTANHCALLFLKYLQREKAAKMMSPSKVHLAGVLSNQILLPECTLFTQAICHCQLVANVRVGSFSICSERVRDKAIHPLESEPAPS